MPSLNDIFKFLYGSVLLAEFSVSIIVLNLLVNFINHIKFSLGPALSKHPHYLLTFYVFGRLFIRFGKSESTDLLFSQKLSTSCERFSGPFEHTFLYIKVYNQVSQMRSWLRNILCIFLICKY